MYVWSSSPRLAAPVELTTAQRLERAGSGVANRNVVFPAIVVAFRFSVLEIRAVTSVAGNGKHAGRRHSIHADLAGCAAGAARIGLLGLTELPAAGIASQRLTCFMRAVIASPATLTLITPGFIIAPETA